MPAAETHSARATLQWRANLAKKRQFVNAGRSAPASAPAASEKKPDYLRGLVFADASGHLRLGVEW